MTAQLALQIDGWCPGPLFAPPRKRRPAKVRKSGGAEVWAKYRRATPPWTTHRECRTYWALSRQMTEITGVQHSVDHIVPLLHPLVCGLHCPANLRVVALRDNQRKSNNWWPDMPGEQEEMFP